MIFQKIPCGAKNNSAEIIPLETSKNTLKKQNELRKHVFQWHLKGSFHEFFFDSKNLLRKNPPPVSNNLPPAPKSFLTRFNVYWSNKKFWMKKLFGVPRTKFLKKFQIFGRFSMTHVGSDFSLNTAKFIWIRKMFVFRSLTSFLSEIFYSTENTLYYMKIHAFSSLLVMAARLLVIFDRFPVVEIPPGGRAARTSNDNKWRENIYFHKI